MPFELIEDTSGQSGTEAPETDWAERFCKMWDTLALYVLFGLSVGVVVIMGLLVFATRAACP